MVLYPWRNVSVDNYVQIVSLIISQSILVLKTEAIDFSQDYIWFDDSPLQSEMRILRVRSAVEKWIIMDTKNP